MAHKFSIRLIRYFGIILMVDAPLSNCSTNIPNLVILANKPDKLFPAYPCVSQDGAQGTFVQFRVQRYGNKGDIVC